MRNFLPTAAQYCDYTKGCTMHGMNPSRKKKFISSPKQSTLALRPTQRPTQQVNRGIFSHKKRSQAMRLTTHLHLVPRLRMSGNVRPLTQYASTGKNLPFYVDIFSRNHPLAPY